MSYSRKTFAVAVLLGVLAARGVSAQGVAPCGGEKLTQGELNECFAARYAKADDEMSAVYKQLLSKYRAAPEFVARLRVAQRAWLRFRDADISCYYYQKDKIGAYGSVYPMCRSLVLTDMTNERTKKLRQMLNPPEEGEVCGFWAAEAPERRK